MHAMSEATIFEAALHMVEPAQRSAYLDVACGGDAVLRRHIEDLLRAHGTAGVYLERPALEQITAEQPEFLQPSEQPGSLGRFGCYEVLEILGRGSSATVLKAFDPGLHRVVAIKVLAPVLAACGVSRQRFLREARAAAAVREEHVVAPHAVEDAPLPYLVMEYIAGQTLQQKLDRSGSLPLREILRIGIQVARGLAAIHAQGLVHRDLKPANILLENGIERVKITDFGLARVVSDANISQPGTVLGTPLYMSPEQAQGEVVDQRSDLFSLGSVLYALCTGKPPFRGADAQAVLRRVIEETPRPVRTLNPDIPGWLSDLIARLHAKRADARPQSACEVGDLLARELAVLQMPARPHATARSIWRGRVRGWTMAAALLIAVVGLAAAEGTGVTQFTGAVIRLFEPDGTLVIETDVPGVSVSVDGKELVITGAGPREVRLRPGGHLIKAGKDGVQVDTPLVTIQRNGRTVVRVHRESPIAAALPAPTGKIVRAAPGAVTAEEVASTFRANVALASEKYADRRITVTGRLLRIADGQRVWNTEKDWGRNYRVEMAAGEGPEGTYLSFQFFVPDKASSPLAKLNVNEVVTIEAECKGWLPPQNQPDPRKCIYFWDGKVIAPLEAAAGSTTAVAGTTTDGVRHLAQWVLSVGGAIHIKSNGKEFWLGPDHELPPGWFSISAVSLSGCKNVGDADMTRLTGPADLRVVRLEYLPITDAGLSHVAQNRNLTQLYLKHASIGDGAIPLLAKLTNLTLVDLSDTKITEAGLQHLDELGRVNTLSLANLPVSDAVMARLAELKYLSDLDLTGTRLTDAGARPLAKLEGLQLLRLAKTALTDAGLDSVAKLDKLFRLNLDGTRIKGDGLKALSRGGHLQELSLADTPLTDAAVELLASITSLRQVTLRGSGMSAAGAARLRRALAKCQVIME
jgi:Protein kinase domain/Leucine Rich repeat